MSLVLRGSAVPDLQAMASELAPSHFAIREANAAFRFPRTAVCLGSRPVRQVPAMLRQARPVTIHGTTGESHG